jgi:hypothetical protein
MSMAAHVSGNRDPELVVIVTGAAGRQPLQASYRCHWPRPSPPPFMLSANSYYSSIHWQEPTWRCCSRMDVKVKVKQVLFSSGRDVNWHESQVTTKLKRSSLMSD